MILDINPGSLVALPCHRAPNIGNSGEELNVVQLLPMQVVFDVYDDDFIVTLVRPFPNLHLPKKLADPK